METMASFCGYEESVEELKNLLVQTILALETARKEAKEDMRRNEENVNQLLYFLRVACEERDEARDQLQKFLSITHPAAADVSPVLPTLPPESPMYLTLSDSISFVSGASPVDSLLDMVSSPDLSGISNFSDSSTLGVSVPQECLGNFADSGILGVLVPVPVSSCVWPQECIGNFDESTTLEMPALMSTHAVAQEYAGINSVAVAGSDTASAVIDSLVRGKTLPEKGKLLQTVMEAGPLLQTLIFSVSLPQWRNPPPPPPPPLPYQMPSTQSVNMNHLSYGSSQMYSTPTLSGTGRNLLQNRFVSGKRQRCQ